MTAADFRRDVERELDQLRRAHVITDVEVETDLVVGVRARVDGRLFELTTGVTTGVQRQDAFAVSLIHLQQLRRNLMPSRRPTPPARPRIPVERAGGDVATWPLIAVLALFCAVMGWLLS